MALNKKYKKFLDSLDDELFLSYVANLYGSREPIWAECTQAEYEEHYGPLEDYSVLTLEKLERLTKNLFGPYTYKAEPYYKNPPQGLLGQLEFYETNPKPDGYKFYKKVGERFLLTMGKDMVEYCSTRECMKPFFTNNQIQ